jgi:type I restriction enzyme M protein
MANTAERFSEPILLVPAGKIRCYVHPNTLRQDTPEEHVRQRVARSLVEEYGYAKSDLHLEFPIKVGSARKKVDIAIFPVGAEHKQETIYAIVEAKRDDIRPGDREEGVAQLKSYMAASINARWGLWVGSEMQAFEKETDARRAVRHPFLEATDIPLKGEAEPKRRSWADLVPATEGLSSAFKRCHNYVHVNGNLGKEKAFFELLKLIFCKVHDEQETTTGVMEFSIAQDERRSDLGQRKLVTRISKLFEAVKGRYPYIFAANELIELDNRSLAYIVSELEKYNFQETSNDIKGEAYEEIVGVTSRRDQGAFFTPRNVCDMAVRMLFATFPPDKRLQLRILDPACGTGGFLRAALLQIKHVVTEQISLKRGQGTRAQNEIHERIRRLCDSNLFGIDKLAELVRAAQMNLAMHGDGSSNVFPANSLLPPGEWADNLRARIKLNHFDMVLTNPPFGSKLPIDDPHILDQFELVSFEAKNSRSSMPPEQLFIERCLAFLKPGGRMAIVLPDSILSNPGLAFIRRWILKRAYIIASIDLPRETFARSDTHTMTSLLILQKFTEEERRLVVEMGRVPEYEIFMAIADRVGWDLRGNPVLLRTPEGEEIHRRVTKKVSTRDARGQITDRMEEADESIIDDHLPAVAQLFIEWLQRETSQGWRT